MKTVARPAPGDRRGQALLEEAERRRVQPPVEESPAPGPSHDVYQATPRPRAPRRELVIPAPTTAEHACYPLYLPGHRPVATCGSHWWTPVALSPALAPAGGRR